MRASHTWLIRFTLTFALLASCSNAASPSGSSPSQASSSPSQALTSPTPTGASAPCTKAEADRVVTDLAAAGTELRGDISDHPVAQILCAAFLGPGSQAMVVSFVLAICYGTSGWAVFRLADGSWRLVQHSGAEGVGVRLAAVGTDIRETEPILSTDDMSCTADHGVQSRVWHWNGKKLEPGPWETTTDKAAFSSPSGNIECEMTDDGTSGSVACRSAVPQNAVQMDLNGQLTICRGSQEAGSCWSGDETTHPVLGYGKRITAGRFRCDSEETGVICVVTRTGKGFTINREGVTDVGATGVGRSLTYSMFHSPSGNIVCEVFDKGGEQQAYCQEGSAKNVTMHGDGQMVIRNELYGDLGDNAPGTLLDYGEQVTVGPFRCSSQPTGVTCVVVESGTGFRIDHTGITRV